MKRWVPKAMVQKHMLDSVVRPCIGGISLPCSTFSIHRRGPKKTCIFNIFSDTSQEIQEDFVQVRLKKQIMLHVYHLQLPNYSDTSLFEGEKEKNGEYHLQQLGSIGDISLFEPREPDCQRVSDQRSTKPWAPGRLPADAGAETGITSPPRITQR